ncbi:MAG TPA: hypothetical protein VFV38_27235 [Ktedonobacteraceae bacterium]|nr:hypothetical protein [Ktedonobacteraceae bacterium]
MSQVITPSSLLQDTQDAATIVESIRASLFALPGAAVETDEPRYLDVADITDPPWPSSATQDIIAVRWKERLSRLLVFQQRLRQNARWRAVEAQFIERTDVLTRGYFSASDPRRKVSVKLAAYLSDEEMRVALLTEMDQVTLKESMGLVNRAVKNGGRLDGYPLLVAGAGKIGTDAALVLQAFTSGRVLIIEPKPRRGGTFRSFTPLSGPVDMAAFETNSRDEPGQGAHQQAIGGVWLTNGFFEQAPIQPVSIAKTSFLGNHLLGAATALNNFLAGPALIGGRVLGVWENPHKRSEEEALQVRVQVGDVGITIPSFGIEVATGLGDFTVPNPENDPVMARLIAASQMQLERFLSGESNVLPKVVTGQGFWQMAVTRGADLFRALINRVVVVAGKKQTAIGVLATLLGDAVDKRIYGDVVNQEGRFAALYWVGPKAHDWAQLQAELQLPPRYARILVDYPRNFMDTTSAITPLSGHMVRFGAPGFREDAFEVLTRSAGGDVTIPDADLVIACTGQANDQTTELFFPLTRFEPLRLVQGWDETALFREVPRYAGRALVIGPAANLPISDAEWEGAPAGVPEAQLRASIGVNTRKAVIASRELARRYNRARDQEEMDRIPF